jgi:hypothetical protein
MTFPLRLFQMAGFHWNRFSARRSCVIVPGVRPIMVYGKENSTLVVLVSALANSPRTILQTLAEKVLEVLEADSAGLSLLKEDEKRFYWAAIAGAWQPLIGGGTPRDFGPCGL